MKTIVTPLLLLLIALLAGSAVGQNYLNSYGFLVDSTGAAMVSPSPQAGSYVNSKGLLVASDGSLVVTGISGSSGTVTDVTQATSPLCSRRQQARATPRRPRWPSRSQRQQRIAFLETIPAQPYSALRIVLKEYCTDSHAEDLISRLREGHQSVTVEKQAVLLNENDEVPAGGQE